MNNERMLRALAASSFIKILHGISLTNFSSPLPHKLSIVFLILILEYNNPGEE